MPGSSYSHIRNMLVQEGWGSSSKKSLRVEPETPRSHNKPYHYIDVQEALNRQADKMLTDPNRYQAGLFLQPAAKTPELSNLKTLGFSKLTEALVVAQVIIHGDEHDKNIVQGLYEPDEIAKCIAFADETLDKKARHENADKVNNATKVFEPGDELVYGEDSAIPRFRMLGR